MDHSINIIIMIMMIMIMIMIVNQLINLMMTKAKGQTDGVEEMEMEEQVEDAKLSSI